MSDTIKFQTTPEDDVTERDFWDDAAVAFVQGRSATSHATAVAEEAAKCADALLRLRREREPVVPVVGANPGSNPDSHPTSNADVQLVGGRTYLVEVELLTTRADEDGEVFVCPSRGRPFYVPPDVLCDLDVPHRHPQRDARAERSTKGTHRLVEVLVLSDPDSSGEVSVELPGPGGARGFQAHVPARVLRPVAEVSVNHMVDRFPIGSVWRDVDDALAVRVDAKSAIAGGAELENRGLDVPFFWPNGVCGGGSPEYAGIYADNLDRLVRLDSIAAVPEEGESA